MEFLLSFIIVPIVILGFFILLRALEVSKRKKEANSKNIQDLKPRKIHRNIFLKGNSSSLFSNVISFFQNKDLRTSLNNGSEAILFTQNANQSKFDGVLNTSYLEMPLRIIIESTSEGLDVKLEEDYGFQMFIGPAKHAFQKKYEQAFDYYEEELGKF